MGITSLPFELDRDEIRPHHLAAREIRGTIRVQDDAIIIAFRLRGAADAAPHQVRVPIGAVSRIRMTGGVFKSPRLLLDVAREELLKPLPWADGRLCVMRFRRAHGVAVRELIEEVEVRMAELAARRGTAPD